MNKYHLKFYVPHRKMPLRIKIAMMLQIKSAFLCKIFHAVQIKGTFIKIPESPVNYTISSFPHASETSSVLTLA